MTAERAEEFLFEIRAEAWGRDLPTVRLAHLIAGYESALAEPCTPRGTSGDPAVDAQRAALHADLSRLEAERRVVTGALREVLDANAAYYSSFRSPEDMAAADKRWERSLEDAAAALATLGHRERGGGA